MASEVDICNAALARIGDSATVTSITSPDGSVQAEHCARFYPVARNTLLEMHPWGFATARADLAVLDTDTQGWAFAYAIPSDCLVTLAVLLPDSGEDEESEPYEVEGDIIYSHAEEAVLRYTKVFTDTLRFSPLFIDALSWLLASYLAGAILKGDTGMKVAEACYKRFAVALSLARASDSNQRSLKPEHTPSWIGARA